MAVSQSHGPSGPDALNVPATFFRRGYSTCGRETASSHAISGATGQRVDPLVQGLRSLRSLHPWLHSAAPSGLPTSKTLRRRFTTRSFLLLPAPTGRLSSCHAPSFLTETASYENPPISRRRQLLGPA